MLVVVGVRGPASHSRHSAPPPSTVARHARPLQRCTPQSHISGSPTSVSSMAPMLLGEVAPERARLPLPCIRTAIFAHLVALNGVAPSCRCASTCGVRLGASRRRPRSAFWDAGRREGTRWSTTCSRGVARRHLRWEVAAVRGGGVGALLAHVGAPGERGSRLALQFDAALMAHSCIRHVPGGNGQEAHLARLYERARRFPSVAAALHRTAERAVREGGPRRWLRRLSRLSSPRGTHVLARPQHLTLLIPYAP